MRGLDPRIYRKKPLMRQSAGLHRTSSLPEVRTVRRRKSGEMNPTCEVKPGNDGGESSTNADLTRSCGIAPSRASS
jgi:hypothetical protein